ncbi:hypothetical protein [Clostridium senegalense]
MESVKKIFNGVELSYLIKSYIFSAIIGFFLIHANPNHFSFVLFIILSGILFPFSALVWDSLIGLLMGNTIISLPLLIMVIWKCFKLLMLYMFAIFIAPFGILYIYLRTR